MKGGRAWFLTLPLPPATTVQHHRPSRVILSYYRVLSIACETTSTFVLLTSHTILSLPSTTRCSHPAHLTPYPLTPSTRTQALDEFSKKGYCTLLQEGDFTESSVPIPLNYVGVLVGPGGMCIRNLQDNLNVNVVLPKSDAATSGFMQQRRKTHEKVLIAGPRAQVALAKDAIKQLVKFYHSEATHPGQVHKEITDIEAHNYNLIIGQRGSVIQNRTRTWSLACPPTSPTPPIRSTKSSRRLRSGTR